MRNQFWYTVSEEEGKKKMGSFNLDYVIRSVEYAENKSVVLLDDFHEMRRDITIPAGKNGKILTKTIEEVVCSEVWLNEEDSARFKQITAIPDVYVTSGYMQTVSPTETAKAVTTLA